MPSLSEFVQSDALPFLIAQDNKWREDERLVALFIWWLHDRYGLSWNQAVYGSNHQSKPGDAVKIDIVNERVSSVSVFRDDREFILSESFFVADILCGMIWRTDSIAITGISERQSDSFNDFLKGWDGQFPESEFETLKEKLITEYSKEKPRQSRSIRLWRKLRSDPVLFFRDSDKLHGKFMYSMIKRLTSVQQ